MKTNKTPQPKSGTILKWIVKYAKFESKPKPKMAIELKPIVKKQQLKLQKPPVCKPSVFQVPRLPTKPCPMLKQQTINTSPFVALAQLSGPELDKRSLQFQIDHVQHFKASK